jgi:hypothetical protein
VVHPDDEQEPAMAHPPSTRQPLDIATVLAVQSVRGYPCISLVLHTTEADRLTDADRVRLEALAATAARRVRAENPERGAEALHRLDEAVTAAVDRPARHGLALFVNPDVTEVVDLPVTVTDRCVVDPTFATRDLVRALHRTPRHVLLVLAADEARLFDGALGRLSPVVGTAFPLSADDRSGRRPGSEGFVRDVDRALGSYLRLHPAPLVLAAAEPTLSQFTGVSRNLARFAGVVPGNHLTTPLAELSRRARPLLEDYLNSREDEALRLLDTRMGQRRAVAGIDACWQAARWERPEMLAVEEGFFYPARLDPDSDGLEAATDATEPGVIDDVVDELIEIVLTRGGWVALVRDGALDERVALTLQR